VVNANHMEILVMFVFAQGDFQGPTANTNHTT